MTKRPPPPPHLSVTSAMKRALFISACAPRPSLRDHFHPTSPPARQLPAAVWRLPAWSPCSTSAFSAQHTVRAQHIHRFTAKIATSGSSQRPHEGSTPFSHTATPARAAAPGQGRQPAQARVLTHEGRIPDSMAPRWVYSCDDADSARKSAMFQWGSGIWRSIQPLSSSSSSLLNPCP